MKSQKLQLWNQRMLLLMAHCIDTGICESQKDFLLSIGFIPTGFRQVKSGAQGFTVSHIAAACKKYKVNGNWILGVESEMTRGKSKSAIAALKEAVRAVEAELSAR